MKKIKAAFQSFGHVIVDPVLYVAASGLLLAIATVCSLGGGAVADFGTLLSAATNSAVIGNLSVIFAVGLTAGFAKKQKANAAVYGLICYLMFLYVNNAYLTLTKQLAEAGEMGLFGTGQAMVLGLQVTDINVFGGIIVGCLSGWVYNKLIDVNVPEVARIYGGPRLALLAMTLVSIVFALVVTIVWPPVAETINHASVFINASGGLGQFIYSFLNRALIPVGLHHFMWMPFDYTAIGGTAIVAGESYSGAANIFFAELPHIASGAITTINDSVRFAMFGFGKEFLSLGAALAIVYNARTENKKAIMAMIVPLYVSAMLSGITEPLDFILLFASPALFMVYSLFYGLSETLLYLFGVRLFNIFGGIELITVNIALPWGVTKFPLYIGLGVVFAIVSAVVFTVMIRKMNIMTPGRAKDWAAEVDGDASQTMPVATITSSEQNEIATTIIDGLGGAENITSLGCCMTRLRVEVKNPELVSQDTIKKAIDKGLFVNGTNVQIVVGMDVHEWYDMLRPILRLED
ncbi:PTS transporter subunit EIIC [Collinsella sp. AGMB00827]|uniref:PTS transporter subunit EIIC n=1 Tax=Collinsella ureilytica TaxID=2869515 RepID=A0ABS7MI87_9ACTN|nr:PTS transporter subunit EIIC [Collinsella urealyticum]MBY4797079.1 PTS transporter subunit EIIC [Collinsella urealyticum]